MTKLKYTLSLVNTGTQLHESLAWGKEGRDRWRRGGVGESFTLTLSLRPVGGRNRKELKELFPQGLREARAGPQGGHSCLLSFQSNSQGN